MPKIITFLMLLSVSFLSIAQVEYNMQDRLVTDCEGTLYDSGGPDEGYDHGEEFTFTICPEPVPACIQLNLGTVFLENNFDKLRVFDGPDTDSPNLLIHNNGVETFPPINAYSGCITIYFESDQTTVFSGWEAKWRCFEEDCPDEVLVPTAGDCLGAIAVCETIYNNPEAYIGKGNILNEINPDFSCLINGERHSVWYKWQIQEAGEIGFSIIPYDMQADYDFSVFNLTNVECSDIFNDSTLLVSCNYSFHTGITGATGASSQTYAAGGEPNQNATIPVQKGETYVLHIDQFSPYFSGFRLDFDGTTAVIGDTTLPAIDNSNNNFVKVLSPNEVELRFTEDVHCQSMENLNLTLEGHLINDNGFCSQQEYARNFTFSVFPPLEEKTYNLHIEGEIADACGNTDTFDKSITFEADNIVGLPPIHQSEIQLYPNPTSDLLFLQLPNTLPPNTKAQLEVFDLQGQKVSAQLLEGVTSNEIVVSDYPRGIYFVKVQIGGEMWGEKVIIR